VLLEIHKIYILELPEHARVVQQYHWFLVRLLRNQTARPIRKQMSRREKNPLRPCPMMISENY